MIRILGIRFWLIVAAVTCAVLLYFLFDPAESPLAPKCVFHLVTGWECPGCGMQRMIHALLHGDIAAAWGYNAFLLCISPLILLMLFSAAFRTRLPRLYAALNSPPAIITITALIIAWGVVRNLI